ncbi:54S ribosomal protein L17 mitochondrial [Actinomortierella ambigua]|nr:54S ribosomal protein L17 mitochondrial [Actinomortierella ambigua]
MFSSLRALARPMTSRAAAQALTRPLIRTTVAPIRLSAAARSYASSAPQLDSNISKSSSNLVSSTKPLIVNNQRIVAGAVVSRQPLILRDLLPFEQEYFQYQKDLERDHAAPFAAEFYFKKGSVAERRWRQSEADRMAAQKAGGAGAKAAEASSSSSSSSAAATEAGGEDEDMTEEERVAAQEAKVEFNDRVTEADRKNDIRSLERALARTLYLIVKKPRDQHAWQFPQGGVHVTENLQEAAGRELAEECGANMDLWFVGRVPIGHYNYSFSKAFRENTENPAVSGAKVFFMKAHIFAGQVQVDNKEIVDYAWVTKQEMKDYVSAEYYEAVKDMLSDL